ncbi:Hsp70 chaperone protein [Apiospora arundinis]|uniref:Hsp70 chaperone protein n=1 Tax=Apiospora arundinis TaxID=335852 RepID=A0ABR2JGT0_9PEZI
MADSRESTATLGRTPGAGERYSTPLPYPRVDDEEELGKKLIIAIDFGTTYSCVSYAAIHEGERPEYLNRDRIMSIENYPNDQDPDAASPMKKQVPTELMYPKTAGFRAKEGLPDMEDGDEPQEDVAGLDDADGDIDMAEADDKTDEQYIEELLLDNSETLNWGYSVHESQSLPKMHSNPSNKPLSRFKLLLDTSPMTEEVRHNLKDTVESLQKRKIIKKPLQLIADFLTCLLRHTKEELADQGYDDSWPLEMVLCVPAIWTQKACRDMQSALAVAMEKTSFKGVDIQNNSIENLFIVSEPEAAAAYVLAWSPEIKAGDTFVLLDAGGGTVDANMYTISKTAPLRLTREVVEPGGGLFGSSYLNEGFRKLLKERLKDELYLERGADTIDSIVEKIIMETFEYKVKRSFDYYRVKGLKKISVQGLLDNDEKLFRDGCLHVPMQAIKALFDPLLQGIVSVMDNQIVKAFAKGSRVEKVVLIGGFASSEKTLVKYIENHLGKFNAENDCRIRLIKPRHATTAVASGAVLRAFNKELGPKRMARSSYGILRTEPFREYEEHEGLHAYYNPYDGQPYIKDTVDWILKLGSEVPPVWKQSFDCEHLIPCWPVQPLICTELLYVSDHATQSHYRLKDARNTGAEKVGEIVVDFTFLREQGWLLPTEPGTNSKGKPVGKRHYKVEYKIEIEVVDRDLKCYAIYKGEVVKKCRINIASAFRPGVK